MTRDGSDDATDATDEVKGIVQAHLDLVSVALWERRWEAVADAVAYPHVIDTVDRSLTMHTREALIREVRLLRDNLDALAATAYHRICLRAELTDAGTIVGLNRTYILRGGSYVVAPYETTMTLVRSDPAAGGDGAWRSSRATVSKPLVTLLYPQDLDPNAATQTSPGPVPRTEDER